MEAHERTISKILTEAICYEIPPYQRPYSWETENVQQLLDDIWRAFEREEPEYFIGSLITIEREKDKRYDVVDGQQRLTTLNLLFARLRDHITDSKAKYDLGRRIVTRNELTDEEETPRLLPRTKDRAFFRRHVLEGIVIATEQLAELDAPKRHMAQNLATIDEFLEPRDEKQLKLFANFILSKVYVVFVNTNSLKSAYRLFNVLNARGLPLSNADLIKNTLFEQLGGQRNRADELEGRWIELEDVISIERLDTFFGHHRTSVTGARPTGTLYEEIQPLIRNTQGGPFTFLESIISSAQNYMRIIDAEFSEAAVLRPLRALHRVSHDEWIPPLLAYLNKPIPGLPNSEFVSLLEKITMQSWIRRLGRSARLTVYFQLISAIQAGRSADDVLQIFRSNAQNEEFLDLLGREVYGMPFDKAVLLRLEEAWQDETVTKNYSGLITIEHVLPQSRSDQYWAKRFTEEQHRAWVHRLGNLTLLSGQKNYRAQHSGFDIKKEIYLEREKRVSFDITKEVCQTLEWTADVVLDRQERLMEKARKLWTIG